MELHSDDVVDCLSPGDHVYLNFAYIYTFLIPRASHINWPVLVLFWTGRSNFKLRRNDFELGRNFSELGRNVSELGQNDSELGRNDMG